MRRSSLARKLSYLLFLPGLLIAAGCSLGGGGGRAGYVPGGMVKAQIFAGLRDVPLRRIMVVRFANETEYSRVEDQVTRAMILALREDPRLEVLPQSATAEEILGGEETEEGERPAWRKLSRLREELDIDAVLFGTVTKYRPHEPLWLGVKVTLSSTASGDFLWKAEASYHARDLEVRRQAKKYRSFRGLPMPGEHADSVLMSSARYIEFVCCEVSSTLVRSLPRSSRKRRGARTSGRD